MEERISEAETRGTASGLAIQAFLEALQQRRTKFKQPTAQESSAPQPKPDEPVESSTDRESGETYKSSLFLTPKKLHERWEQYSPTFKAKIQRYSPNPIKKIKELFAQTEDKSSEEIGTDKDDGAMEGENDVIEISRERGDKYAAFYLDNDNYLNNESSHEEKVPCKAERREAGKKRSVDKPPFIVLQEPDSTTNELDVIGIEPDVIHRRKSPLTVQEWVDHLPSKPKLLEKDCEDSSGSKDSDHLGLADIPPHEDKKSLIAARLSREASVQSSSSLDSLLDARRPDPVEVLLNLGFGAVPGVDMEHCRIPKRFLVPSKCKGGDWNEFLRRELLQAQNFECASLGFRGLSGPSHQRPSAIVANIMEKLRERNTPRPPTKSKFSTVARRILNERSVLNKLTPEPSQSVLSPDNRKFLDSQGKISPEVPRRRIIFGQKSFAFANDGELIEVEPSTSKRQIQHKDSTVSLNSSISGGESDPEDTKPNKVNTKTLKNPDANAMLKLRRSSLQRQKKIEGDYEDVNHVVEPAEQSTGTNNKPPYQLDENLKKKSEKIPVRFVSSGNLKLLYEKDKTPDEIRLELENEIKSLSQKIQFANPQELSSILLQIKDVRTKLDNQ